MTSNIVFFQPRCLFFKKLSQVARRDQFPQTIFPHSRITLSTAVRRPRLRTPGEMLTEGRCAVRRFTEGELMGTNLEERVWRHPQWIPAAYVLDDADQFDASLFGIAANEAGTTGIMRSASRTARGTLNPGP